MSNELLPCPFCGAGTFDIRENTRWNGGMRPSTLVSVEVRHWCEPIEGQPHPRVIIRVGRDEESAVKSWNTRTEGKHE
jgi:hypothetical protein